MIEQKNNYSFSIAAEIRAQKLEDWLNTSREKSFSPNPPLFQRPNYKWSQQQNSWFIKS